MRKTFSISAILIFLFISLNGQWESLDVVCTKCSFEEFIEKLEIQTSLEFFYNPEDVEGLIIDINEQNSSIDSILAKALKDSNLQFSQIRDSSFVFTMNYSIKTDFPEEYRLWLAEGNKKTENDIKYLVQTEEKDGRTANEEFILHEIGNPSKSDSRFATIHGYVKNKKTGQPIIGAVIYSGELERGTVTNAYGYYSLRMPPGRYDLEFRSIGFNSTKRKVQLFSDGGFNVVLTEKVNPLKEVVITADRDHNVQSLSIGVEKIDLKTLKIIPAGMGEADVIKSTQLLPGVQTVGEAAAGFNVRGGSTDQNLVLLDGAPIYNTSHFFGFFSAFNPDMIDDVTLYKSGIPLKYGGRVSSVMNISLREGNRKNYKVSGGVNPVFFRLLAEGPIIKDKASFAFSSRLTYSDWVLKQFQDARIKKSSAGFNDFNLALSSDINKNNSVYFSAYTSSDKFDLYQSDKVSNSNLAGSLRWRHNFNAKLFAVFSLVHSDYRYHLESGYDSLTMKSLDYSISNDKLKAVFVYYPHPDHRIEGGFSSQYYSLNPGKQVPLSDQSLAESMELETENALESAIFLSDEFSVSPRISISGGIRYSFYQLLGPSRIYRYADGVPRTVSSIKDTLNYGKYNIAHNYSTPEFRLAGRIKTGVNSSVKLGFDQSAQYIHMISNTTAISPTDIWKLSDPYLLPQKGTQISGGYFLNLRRNTVELSIETYYKKLHNIIDYKDGAQLLMNEYLETDLLNGKGKAYGIEFMIKKPHGRWTGWLAYSYSRIFHRVKGNFESEEVNSGNFFPANYDKPHDLKLVNNIKFSRRVNASATFVYNTGRPITYPVAFYEYQGSYRVYYSDRNSFRIPDYARLDLALTFNGDMRAEKLNHGSFTFAVYNVLGRKNPYSVFFRGEEGEIKGYQMSIYGRPIFTVSYNFKIRGNASDDY